MKLDGAIRRDINLRLNAFINGADYEHGLDLEWMRDNLAYMHLTETQLKAHLLVLIGDVFTIYLEGTSYAQE